MSKKIVQAWIVFSFLVILGAELWRLFDPESRKAMIKFYAVLSSLLAVGYFVTPSNSIFGKISFGFVVLMVIGIIFKVFHYLAGDAIIITGLSGVFISFAWRWKKERKVF